MEFIKWLENKIAQDNKFAGAALIGMVVLTAIAEAVFM